MLKRITVAILFPGLLVLVVIGVLAHISPIVTNAQDVDNTILNSMWSVRSCAATPPYLLLSMYANTSDMEQVFIQCGDKTVQRYPLDRVRAYDRVLVIFSEFTPPVDEVCTASFYNQAGMFVQGRLSQMVLRTPTGCDHPGDENVAGDMPYPPPDTRIILPDGGRSTGQVALLNTGFVYAATRLLLTNLGEPARLVSSQFDPFSLAQQLPVLLIPSGGLDMLQNSAAFRARLETYTRQGGIVIVLAQPHGHVYSLLPGGKVSGSGWQEDEGYLSVPVVTGSNHPVLTGLEQAEFSVHSRGHLSDPPPEGQVLLKRADNKAVALIYPYHQGHIIATTLYEDWSCATGQCSPQTHIFLRDLLSWAIASGSVSAFAPGEDIELSVPVVNIGGNHADGVELSLITPERAIVQQQVLSTSLEPGDSTTLTFNTTTTTPPGIWRVDATMVWKRGDHYLPLAPRVPITYFLVIDPSKISPHPVAARELPARINFNVTASLNKPIYMPGDTAYFTLTITTANPTKVNLSAKVRYGDFEDIQPVTLTSQTRQAITFSIPITPAQGDTLGYGLYDAAGNGLYFNTRRLYFDDPSAKLSVYPDKPAYASGETVRITVVATPTGVVQLIAPDYSQTFTMTKQITTVTFAAPSSRGEYPLVTTLDNGPYRAPTRVQTYFTVVVPWVRMTDMQLTRLPNAPGDIVEATLTVDSTEPLEAVLQNCLDYPGGTCSILSERPVSLKTGTNVLTLTLPLSTTQAGSHLLTYQLVDPVQTDYIYSMGARTFDVGTAMLLGINTSPFQSFRGAPIQPVPISVAIFSASETPADLAWYLDDQLITSQSINLISGTQIASVTLPPPDSPGWHTVQVDLTANGLSSQVTTDFAFETFGSDIVVNPPRFYKPSGYTATVYTYLYNMGDRQTPTTTVKLYDGNPAEGGKLIGESAVPPLPPRKPFYNHTEEVYLSWDVRGKAGPHTLYAIADANNEVQEIDEDNNLVPGEGEVPPFTLNPRTDKENYARGEPVVASVGVANLQTHDMSLTMTLVADLLGFKPFRISDTLIIPAQTMITPQYVWQDTDTRGGVYNLVAEAGEIREYSQFSLPYTAQFLAQPLTGTVPLSVTFTDLSTPWSWIETWQWDFGDGKTSTESDPVHIYKKPGLYTVTLTTTVPITGLFPEGRQKIIEQDCFAKQIADEAFIFTIIHPITATASK